MAWPEWPAGLGVAMAGTPVRGKPTRGEQARTSLAQFTGRERGRGEVMPGTFRAAVAAEMGQAFSPPYQVPIVVAVNGLLMAGAWFLLPRGWLFTLQSPLAFPVILSSWMYADVPATNVLAPDRIRVLAALGDRTMISRLLLAKTAVLWVFVAPLCVVLALVVGVEHHDALLVGAEIIAICVVPVACLPVAALVGIRWPYHPLQLRYRWDHRVPLRRMVVRWLILAVVPYVLVPALCLLMIVPAVVLLVLTHSANSHVISFIDAEGKRFGLVLSGHSHPLSGGMFAACVALTCGVAVVVWVLGRRADLRLIARRQSAIAAYLADPTQG